jgi:hypothetical protein
VRCKDEKRTSRQKRIHMKGALPDPQRCKRNSTNASRNNKHILQVGNYHFILLRQPWEETKKKYDNQ